MKATLEFNLPEDKEEYERHRLAPELEMKAGEMHSALCNIVELFRGRAKYQETNVEVHKDSYQRILDIINERGIEL